jgi:5-methylcytosine-specific restriction endonuclease McrA
MELKHLSNAELLGRMEKLVRTERRITHLVLLHIIEIEERKLYAERGFDGMYTYLTRGLGYSEGSAYRRLQSARLLKQIPEVAEKIEDGSLNLTQLTQVQKNLKQSPLGHTQDSLGRSQGLKFTKEILSKIENKNSFETQKVLAKEMNLPVQVHEKIKPQADESIRLEVTLTAEQFQDLEKARSLLSHICPEGSWGEVIATLAENYTEKKTGKRTHPVNATAELAAKVEFPSLASDKKAQLDVMDKPKVTSKHEVMNKPETTPKSEIMGKSERAPKSEFKNKPEGMSKPARARKLAPARKFISILKKREVFQKAHHCCEYTDPGTKQRCGSKFYLEIDHIRPVALGGGDELSNLRLLCRTHNALAARKWGLKFN